MTATRRISFLAALLLTGTLPLAPGSARAQQTKEAGTLEALVRQAPHQPATDKIAPSMNAFDSPEYKAHSEVLKRLYPAELMDPLSDNFDRTVPGGFKAALARARAAGVPDALLAEIEATRAMFDVNYPALAAALTRLEAAQSHWQVTTSEFPSQQEFDIFLRMMRGAVQRERTEPGSFAQTAMRLRKRAIARAVYNDLRLVDRGTDICILDHVAHLGQTVPAEAWLAKVVEAFPRSHLAINRGADVTGQPFGPQHAGVAPAVPPATYRAVADAVPDEFWKPFRIPDATLTPTVAAHP